MSGKNENDDQTEFSTLQNNFIKQQAQISALKELVRKTEITNEKTTFTQEKVKNIAQRLTHIKSKVRTRQIDDVQITAECSVSTPDIKSSSEKPRNEKFLLLRQQMKQNKLKMAEREITKKEIEEKVVQLKAKIDSTQLSLEKSTELGRSMTELSSFSGTPVSRFRSSADLSFIPLNIDKERIKFLENRIKYLEKQLENEKDLTDRSENKNQIETLECKILDLQDILKEKERIIQARTAHSEDSLDLLEISSNKIVESENNIPKLDGNQFNEIEFLKSEILNLKEINNRLEDMQYDLTIKNSKLELEFTNVQELNKNLQNQVFSLEKNNSLAEYITLNEQSNPDAQVKETDSSDADKFKTLEICLESEREKLQCQLLKIQEYEEQLMEKDVEYNVLKANFLVLEEKFKSSPKTLFPQNTDKSGDTEINKLKQQLDDSNKSMIKLKLKTKQLQKQIDEFGKISNNNESFNLVEENRKQQKLINDLQNENRQLQLNLVSNTDESSHKKIEILETTCYNQASAIAVLEADKLKITDTLNQLQNIKTELYILLKKSFEINNKKITIPEIESITLEEIIANFSINVENLALYNNYYINLNTDLIDDIGKSKKSNSSRESIEFVDRPTQQEKDKLVEFEQVVKFNPVNAKNKNNSEYAFYSEIIDNDLIDSLVKLREESSELLHKIEIFTTERIELLGKMDTLSNDNQENIQRIDFLGEEKLNLQENVATLRGENLLLENKILNISDDNAKLKEEIYDLRSQIDGITKSVATKSNISNNPLTNTFIHDCENHLEKLFSEIQNYRKISNKNNKLQASKTLANEAEILINDIKNLIEINKSVLQRGVNAADTESNIENLHKIQSLEMEIAGNTKDECSNITIQESNSLQSILNSKVQMLEKENHTLKSLTEEFKEQLIESFNEKQLIENHNDELTTELNNKQETINTINSQLMDLYDSMEKKTAMMIEKEDSLFHYREMFDANLLVIQKLEKENNENKNMFEKHVQYETDKLRARIDELEKLNADLEMKTVKQLEKLKKFAANIKKKTLDYNNLEEKMKCLEQKHSEQNLYELQEKNKFLEEKHCSDQKILDENNYLQERIKFLEERNCSEQKLLEENNNLKENIKFLEEKGCSEQKLLKEHNDLEKIKILEERNCSEQKLLEENNNLKENIKFLEEKSCSEQKLLKENNDLLEKIKILEEINYSEQKLLEENNDLREKIKYFENEVDKLNVSKLHEIINISEDHKLMESNLNLVKMELANKRQELEHSEIDLQLFMNERDTLKSENITHLQNIENKNIYIEDLLSEINMQNVKLNNFQNLIKEKDNEMDQLKIKSNLNSINSSNLEIAQLKCNELQQKYIELFHIYNTERQSFRDKIFKLETLYELVEGKLNDYISSIDVLESDTMLSSENKANILNNKSENKTEPYKLDQLDQQTVFKFDEKLKLKDNNEQIPYLQHVAHNLQVPYLQQVASDNTRLEKDFENSWWNQLQKNQTENSHRIQLSESDLITINKNQTDDEALIENENKRLKDILKKTEAEIEMYKRTISQLQQSASLPLNEEFEEVANTEKFELNEKYDILTKEITELKIIISKKDEHINNLMKFNKLGTSTSISNENIINEVNKLSNRPTHSDDETISSFVFCPPYFDEEVFEQPKEQFTDLSLEQSVDEKIKIENLQQNVADLEIIVEDLKNKLQHLTKENETVSLQMDQDKYRYDISIKDYKDQIKTLKSELELSFQQNIENIITTDSFATIQSLINSDSDTIETNYLCESGDVNDGWSWGENKSLEEKNKKIAVIATLFESEKMKVQSFATRVEELELEQKRLHDEKQALQIKSGKMMKKLKEYKIKVDQQSQFVPIVHSLSPPSVDLDLAIQEEMKNQIFQLEKKTTEIMKELTSEKIDKNNLLKRINTLVASNEKLTEIKDEQHIEINNLQRFISKMSPAQDKKIHSSFENVVSESSAFETSLEPLEMESCTIRNNVDSLVEEFHNKVNENLDLTTINKIEDTQGSTEYSGEKKEKELETEITDQDDSSCDTKIASVNKFISLNDQILFCKTETEEKWNSKIREFLEMWLSNILENGSISQESVNILQNKLRELLQSNEDEKSDIVSNMSKTLENQKLEIVTLQDQLALRSAQCDPYAQISYSIVSSPLGQNNNSNKSERDLTLYMLHQRDMRCEELQLELINLLKERDILQLKLSNTIRQNEEFRQKLYGDNELPYEQETEKDSLFNSSSISLQKRFSQLDLLQNSNILENKDRVLERMQQDVANIPTEAVTELVGEKMTNSTESASTLLLNWIWGKSQPS